MMILLADESERMYVYRICFYTDSLYTVRHDRIFNILSDFTWASSRRRCARPSSKQSFKNLISDFNVKLELQTRICS